jgi:hypothetical protein
VQIPIACSLEPGDARSQLGEWQEVFRRAVDRSERVSPNRLELSLFPDSDLASIVNLTQREAACCPFFAFTIEISAQRVVLAIEVPDDAVQILDRMVPSDR